jgi:hypothetical protein
MINIYINLFKITINLYQNISFQVHFRLFLGIYIYKYLKNKYFLLKINQSVKKAHAFV